MNVTIASNFYSGFPALDGSTPQKEAEIVKAMMMSALKARFVAPGSKAASHTARMEVVLTNIIIAHEVTRVLLDADSSIGGFVTLVDSKTGRKLADDNVIVGSNPALRGSGNLGIPIAFVVNLATAGGRYEKPVNSFVEKVGEWSQRPAVQ